MTTTEYISQSEQFENQSDEMKERVAQNAQLLHGVIGLSDELLEFVLEIADEKSNYEKTIKEAGDIMWYIAIMCRKYGYTIEVDSVIDDLDATHSLAVCVQRLLDAFKKHVFYGKELDHAANQFHINCIARNLADICQVSIETILERNIAKLSNRYSNSTFSNDAAINKDETNE